MKCTTTDAETLKARTRWVTYFTITDESTGFLSGLDSTGKQQFNLQPPQYSPHPAAPPPPALPLISTFHHTDTVTARADFHSQARGH